MPLREFQTALGRLVRDAPAFGASRRKELDSWQDVELDALERADLIRLASSQGLEFTKTVQRSWCEGRAARGAHQTLSMLPAELRQSLLDAWVTQGGGTRSLFAGEAEAFLEFIAARLPDPSHALTLCRLEQAVHRISSLAAVGVPRHGRPLALKTKLCASSSAALLPLFVDPEYLLAAVRSAEPLARDAQPTCHLLFAPGLPGLCRRATKQELRLWAKLRLPVEMQELLKDGHERASVEALIDAGAIEAVTAWDSMR